MMVSGKLNSATRDCTHNGEGAFLASSSYGFIQNQSDPRCIHCAWNELHEAMPDSTWRVDRLSFLLTGWAIEIASPQGVVLSEKGRTPAEAMDRMTSRLYEERNNA
jgi:hypothetical protein